MSKFAARMRAVPFHAALRLKGRTHQYLAVLRESERAERRLLYEAQDRLRLRIVTHASKAVPYYRQLFECLDLRGDRVLSEWETIPTLNRSTLIGEFETLKSEVGDAKHWKVNSSGGSTGEPVRFVQDSVERDWARALKLNYDSWTGYSVGERKILLWGSERDLFFGKETLSKRVVQRFKGEILLNAFRMKRDDLIRYVDIVERFKPAQILAYVDAAHELATFMELEGRTLSTPPRAIMTSAGTLYDEVRQKIERVFGTPVFNRYGSREVGDVACDCGAGEGLHVSPLTHFVEIVGPDGRTVPDGQLGEIVVTSLTNVAMPLIRYRIGDMGVKSARACSCGRSWPLLERVEGRSVDMIRRRDGTSLSPLFLVHMIGVVVNQGWVRKFQVVQHSLGEIEIRIVLWDRARSGDENMLGEFSSVAQKVAELIGPGTVVRYTMVEEIAKEPSGKFRYVVSKVNSKSECGDRPNG